MIDAEKMLRSIRRAYPELPIASARPLDHDGQYSDILVVNENLIFRFPRYSDTFGPVATEALVLRAVRGALPLAVPDPRWVCTAGDEPGDVFIGYPLIAGRPLWRRDFQRADAAFRRAWARQLGEFLHALHGAPLGDLPMALPLQDTAEDWRVLFAEVSELLLAAMRPDARRRVRRMFERVLADDALLRFTPALRHGDFGPGNWLYEPESGRISGVIDFGFAGLGDPATDLAAVATLGRAFLADLNEIYGADEATLTRADLIRATFALQEAVHGAKHGDGEAYESGMEEYI